MNTTATRNSRSGGRLRPLEDNTGRVSPPPARKALLGTLYDWQDAYRCHAYSERVAKCNHVRIANAVRISVRTDTGRAHYHGLVRCGSAWECPVCSAKIKAGRAEEVKAVVKWHCDQYGARSAFMITLTIRHYEHHELKALRAGVAKAWRKVQGGKAWQLALRKFGIKAGSADGAGVVGGFIRAQEVTVGPNGWHPHLHIVFLTRLSGCPSGFERWLLRRWQRAIHAVLGFEHVPNARGISVTSCSDGTYLQKLGLELTAAPTKQGHVDDDGNRHRTPLELMADFARDGDADALALYREYAAGMKGARMLTWSVGLKAAAGILERDDQEIVEGEDGPEEEVAIISAEEWDNLRHVPGAKATLLEVAEQYGNQGVFIAVDTYLGRKSSRAGPHRKLTPDQMAITLMIGRNRRTL